MVEQSLFLQKMIACLEAISGGDYCQARNELDGLQQVSDNASLENSLFMQLYQGLYKLTDDFCVAERYLAAMADGESALRQRDFSQACQALIQVLSEKQKLQGQLEASDMRYHKLVEEAPFPIVITFPAQDMILFANSRAAELLTVAKEELINRPFSEFYCDSRQRMHILIRLFNSDRGLDTEVQLKKRSGEPFWAIMALNRIVYNGNPAALVSISDITEVKKAELLVKKNYEEQRLMTDILECLYDPVDWDAAFQAVCQKIAAFVGGVSVNIYGQCVRPDGNVIESWHVWGPAQLDVTVFREWLECFRQNEQSLAPTAIDAAMSYWNDFKDDERRVFPIWIGNHIAGLLVIDGEKRRDRQDIDDLKNIEHMTVIIANAMEQKRTRDELVIARKTAEEKSTHISELHGRLSHSKNVVSGLLDNTGQGILTFDGDLLIASEYSSECRNIFGQEISGRNFVDLVFAAIQEKELHATIFRDVLQMTNAFKQQVCLSLLPAQVTIHGRAYCIAYKVIPEPDYYQHNKMMVILTDLTERLALQAQIEEERAFHNMIVRVVEHYDTFMDSVRELKNLFFGDDSLADYSHLDEKSRKEFCREMHTLKGIFGHFGFRQVVEFLNELEGFFSYGYDIASQADREMVIRQEIEEIRKAFDVGWQQLVAVLGERFFLHENRVQIDYQQLLELENRISSLLPAEDAAKILPQIRRWRYKSLTDMLLEYRNYVVDLGKRFDKQIKPLVVRGENVMVNPTEFQDFMRSLIHIFRNMVDHGIEQPEERIAYGKPPEGQITCEVKAESGFLYLDISDDGRGVDRKNIRGIATAKGLLPPDGDVEDGELFALLFHPGFSTKSFVTVVSGRGIGLDAVKSMTEKMGGEVYISQSSDQGTTFRFLLGRNFLLEPGTE